MDSIQRFVALLSVGLMLASSAWGSLFVEPSVTFETGHGSYVSSNPSYLTRSIHYSGTAFGVRVGARAGGFWLGIEPVIASGKMSGSSSDGTTFSDQSYSQTEVFGLIGYNFTEWLNAWVGASVYDQRKEVYSSQESVTVTGNSYKTGALAKIFKNFGLGLEYQLEQPTQFNDTLLGSVNVSGNYSKSYWTHLTFIAAIYF